MTAYITCKNEARARYGASDDDEEDDAQRPGPEDEQ